MAWRILVEQATKGEDIHVWGDPNRRKDMVYVKDLCQMFYKACFVDRDYGFYNVGTGVGVSLLDQIKGIAEVFGEGNRSKILFAPEMRNAPQYIMCIDEAKKELGYEPRYQYVEMLEDMKKERDLDRFK
jgi:UDP-glucose 4-epimerase